MAERDLDAYLEDCTKIEPLALQEEFVRVPGDLAFWNAQYANIYQLWLEKKFQRERTWAICYEHHQTTLQANTKGQVLVGDIEACVLQDPNYCAAKVDEITAEAEKVRLHGIMDALRAKRDMLISIGAHQRLEMGNDPSIRTQQAVADAERSWGR